MSRYDNQTILNDENGNRYLGQTLYPKIPTKDSDILIQGQYGRRLDSLAFDYYGDVKLWWIIAKANPENQSGGGSIYMNPNKQYRIPTNIGQILAEYEELND